MWALGAGLSVSLGTGPNTMPGLTILIAAIGPLGVALVAIIGLVGLAYLILSLADAGRDSFL